MDRIINYIRDMVEGVKILPWNNGGAQIILEDAGNIPGVLSTIANAMEDWGIKDIQITINQGLYTVFLDDCEREEGEEEDAEYEEENLIQEGMLIAYRMNFVTVLRIEEDGVWVRDPYGVKQKLDWEDVEKYNPGIEHR